MIFISEFVFILGIAVITGMYAMVLERICPQYSVVGYIIISLFDALTIISVFKSGILIQLFS
ncbi:hypothetical protein [Butyricicoccus sp. Marseille-Q5471]|uniref:hypothetical protein n=1 Tax=Butyricicoccus sp. Marseille-Q5471 TaxID=3039493 RepID=UPI0024BCDDAA|nr:hypothetical protein [Butyricicoccus sp. Marseille-Q5471]